ncbi:hypothetical protein SCUCBS95973_002165 [Sporothrix curviconia]|uniref:chitin deacetylase n=1 Tax=Sporothrix curviconia TaxID=1260050 RepID=A0ABP0B4M2_9PEZI
MLCSPRLLRLPSKLRRRARRQRMATLLALLALVGLLFVPFYIVYKPPRPLISYFVSRWPDVLWRVDLPVVVTSGDPTERPAQRKLVALTIDDAPSEYTRGILEVLHEYDAHATFFVIGGQVSGRASVLREALAPGGHELANHGMHDEPARSLTDSELQQQIAEVDGMLQQVYDSVRAGRHGGTSNPALAQTRPPRFYRPGSGFFSDRMRNLVTRLGYKLVLGGVYPHDAQINYPWVNAKHVLSMLKPGAIVICHDRRSWTAPMLRTMLPAAIKQGYQFVTVTELLEAGKEAST